MPSTSTQAFASGSGVDLDWNGSEDEMIFAGTSLSAHNDIAFLTASAGNIVAGYAVLSWRMVLFNPCNQIYGKFRMATPDVF